MTYTVLAISPDQYVVELLRLNVLRRYARWKSRIPNPRWERERERGGERERERKLVCVCAWLCVHTQVHVCKRCFLVLSLVTAQQWTARDSLESLLRKRHSRESHASRRVQEGMRSDDTKMRIVGSLCIYVSLSFLLCPFLEDSYTGLSCKTRRKWACI